MIFKDIDLMIGQLQKEINDNEQEINRLYFVNVNKRHELKELQANRDEQSGLKTRVLDEGARKGKTYNSRGFF